MNLSDILLLSDFDMTLYWNGAVPRRNIDAINRFVEEGGSFTVATGRAKPSFARHALDVPTNAPHILSNGALIYSYADDKTFATSPLTPDEQEKILWVYERFNRNATFEVEAGLEVYLPDQTYAIAANDYTRQHFEWIGMVAEARAISDIPNPWLKAVFSGHPDLVVTLRDAACEMGLNAVRSLPFMCEVQGGTVSKGVAARQLAHMLGKGTLVCVGDAANDLEMLKAADHAFVPQNVSDEVRAYGYTEVCHCENGAIADVIDILRSL